MPQLAILAVVLLIPAVYYDLRERRIPNVLVGTFLLATPLAIGMLGSWQALPAHLGAAGIAFSIGFLLWLLGWLGAGDAKLLALLGMMVGLKALPSLLVNVALCGLVLAVLFLAIRGLLGRTLWRYGTTLKLSLAQRRFSYVHPGDKEQAVRLPYAVAIAAGTVLTYLGVTPL